jgi:hypothetical protein
MVVSTQPAGEGFRAVLMDTKTGQVLINDVPRLDPSWGIRLNQAGTIQLTIAPKAKELAKMDIRNATMPNFRALGISYDGVMLEAGPILSRSYDDETSRLTVQAAGLWSIFYRRKLVNGSALKAGYNVTGSTASFGPTSLGTIARNIVRVSIQDNYYDPNYGALNIVLPPVIAGTHKRNYYGYDLISMGEALKNLTEVEGGPDIRFRPRFMADDPDRVEWVMETGTDVQPLLTQAGAAIRLDGTAKKSPVLGFSSEEDGTEVANRVWRPGAGQEKAMKLGVGNLYDLLAAGMPWMEYENGDSKEINDVAVLNAQARWDVREHQGPAVTFNIRIRTDHPAAKLGQYWPGDYADVVIPADHPTLPAGLQRVRIMAIDGNDTRQVRLTVAPFLGSYAGPTTTAATYTTS